MNGHVLSRRALYTRHFKSNFTGRCMSARSSCGHTITLMAHSSKAPAHVLVLLKNLNFQRSKGQFCDCVIRLQLNPEKLYLAHRNILAASSPVLASLLSSQGTLLDLQFPGLTHKTLELLLEFIYTGSLPPSGLEDSVHAAAACLEIEELLHALDCRRAISSESPKHMEADENASYLENFVETQETGRNNKTASHCQVSEWRRQSCEVVPVIRHTGDRNHEYDGCDTRKKRAGDCRTETPRFGHSAQHDGLSAATGQESLLHETKHPKYCSVIRDAVNGKFLDTAAETLHHPHVAMKEDVKTEVQIKAKSVIVNTLHSETANACIYTVHTKTECSPPMQSNTSTEIISLRNFNDQEGTSDQEAVDTSSNSNKTSDVNSHHMLENGHSAVINQLDSKICNVTSPVLNAATVAQKILGNADGQTAVEKKNNCFAEGCEFSDFSWGLEKKSSDCRQACMQPCPKRSITPNPDPWNITANSCTENYMVSQKIRKPLTSTESHHGSQGDAGLNIPDSDREKEEFFSLQKNDMLDYKGLVTYHYLHRQQQEISNLEDEGYDGAMVNGHDHGREDSCILPKHAAMDSSEIMETAEGSSSCSSAQISSIGLVGAQQYRCAVCERHFSQRGSLNRHLRSHLGVRPYSCPRCPMTFSRQYRVLEHLRVHQRSCHGFQRTGPT